MRFGLYLQELRRRRSLSRVALSRRCRVKAPDVAGMSAESLKGWELERGGRIPNAGQVDVLVEALGLSFEEVSMLLRLARARASGAPRKTLLDAPPTAA